uniref:Feline leukemia virus subgroup C receptor-related protein 2-like n=2 Tax=Ciona intestinalis TaxID=7719 RepID=F6VES6_CIOIN|nr:feline leukemia virus subgroup C receptor-related protein 2-like isoform X1 [Ciona intestinalis]XP_026693931.1 feline leukemia virus subgroup C receptor-related protein 2-like isoform X1 [Ciona intestinalis]|eukprot:XP_026693930.1 feline leukemia virus subgroup C receptor-related protein 2-like isoform X1 [Ciona intestinalis]
MDGTSFMIIEKPVEETRVYRRRWFMLLLFSLYSGTNAFQWIHYSIISNIITRFYGVAITTTDWLSMVFMLCYIPLIFPVTWLLDRKGLRVIAILGSTLNALGALIKVASAEPHLFAVTMLGQTICSIAQVFILGMPSKVAATWFGPKEVSTACSIAVFGNQVGVALGFLLPPLIVPDSNDNEVVSIHLRYLFIGTAAVTTALALLVIVFFRKQPTLPPSKAQALFRASNEQQNESYIASVKQLIFSTPSLLLIISYGVNTGSFYAISTLLNQEILNFYPDNIVEAGQIGLTMVLAGIVGSVVCGVWLDRTRIYKMTTVGIYVSTLLFMVLYTATLNLGQLWIVFIASGALGFTMTGYLPIGFEFAAELTYPVSEGTSSGLLNASAQIFGIVFTLCMGQLIPASSVLGANLFICATLLIGSIITATIKENLKRQAANRTVQTEDIPDNEILKQQHI